MDETQMAMSESGEQATLVQVVDKPMGVSAAWPRVCCILYKPASLNRGDFGFCAFAVVDLRDKLLLSWITKSATEGVRHDANLTSKERRLARIVEIKEHAVQLFHEETLKVSVRRSR